MVQGCKRKRPEDKSFEAFWRECLLEVERPTGSIFDATGNDDSDTLRQPPECELERALGGLVHPLRVVDRDDKRICSADDRQHGKERSGRRQWVRRLVSFSKQQRHLECLPLRCRQGIAHLVEEGAYEVAEGSEREVRLGLGWPGLEHPIASLTGRANGLEHDGRLADAGLALDQEPDRPAWHPLREAGNGHCLTCASDHVDHRSTLDVAAGETQPRVVGSRVSRSN